MNPGLSDAKAHPSISSTPSQPSALCPPPTPIYLSSTHHPASLPLICAPIYPSTNPSINPPIPPSSISCHWSSHLTPSYPPIHLPAPLVFYSFVHQAHPFTPHLGIYQHTHKPTIHPSIPPCLTHPPFSSPHHIQLPSHLPYLPAHPPTHPLTQHLQRASYEPGTVVGAENT